eukprot:PhF_6_TR5611/c1_g1_i5/m.8108
MGKGKCIALLEESINTCRCMIGCACLTVLAGPALFIIGIVMLVSPNNREANVQQYNAAAKAFASGDFYVMQGSTMYYNGVRLYSRNEAVPVSGNKDEVNNAQSQYFYQSNILFQTSVNVTANTSVLDFGPVTVQKDGSYGDLSCSCSCSSSSSSSSTCCHCSMGYGDCPRGATSYSGRGGTCYKNRICGTCYGPYALTNVCPVVSISGTKFLQSSRYGCIYPSGGGQRWNIGQYSKTNNPTGTVSVYADTDPYIKLLELTQGSLSFGLTEAQQRGIGLALTVVGSALMFCIFGGCFYLCCHQTHKQRFHNMTNQAFGRPAYYNLQSAPPMGADPSPPQPNYGTSAPPDHYNY